MMGWTWNGGEMVVAGGVSFEDRGFRWGMSVFETLRVAGGRTQFVAEHLFSLELSAGRCGMQPEAKALDAARELLFDPPVTDGVARMYLSAGEGGVRSPIGTPRVLVFFEESNVEAPRIKNVIVKTVPAQPVFAGLKTGNYWLQVHWLQEALAEGFDEAILLNVDGTVRSACMGNVFLQTAEGWVTPDATSGARMGIVRGWLAQSHSIVEREVRVEELHAASSIIITNSNLGVHCVQGIGNRRLEVADEEGQWQDAFSQAGW